MPVTAPSSTIGTTSTRWWRKISASCGVGGVAADLDVVGRHVLADRLSGGRRAALEHVVERLRTKPAEPSVVEVAGEHRVDELALAEDAEKRSRRRRPAGRARRPPGRVDSLADRLVVLQDRDLAARRGARTRRASSQVPQGDVGGREHEREQRDRDARP